MTNNLLQSTYVENLNARIKELEAEVEGVGETLRHWRGVLEHLEARNKHLEEGITKQNNTICQTLGKVLGFPWYKDDQKNFPGATEENGICEGYCVAEDLAIMASDKIKRLEALIPETKS